VAIKPNEHPTHVLTLVPSVGASYTYTLTYSVEEKLAISFVPTSDILGIYPNIDECRVYVSAVSGNPRIQASIWSDDGTGKPGSALSNGYSGWSGTLSAAGWVSLSWSSPFPQLSSVNQYWLVIECVAGTSATIRIAPQSQQHFAQSANASYRWRGAAINSTDGSTWNGTYRANVCGFRIRFTDGTDVTYIGLPWTIMSYRNPTAYSIYGSREDGICFTTPSYPISIKSVSLSCRRIGTPPNPIKLKLYQGNQTTAIAETNSIPYFGVADTARSFFEFNQAIRLKPNTKYRITGATSGGDSSNYYQMYNTQFDADSVSGGTVDLIPWSCDACCLSSGSWSDTQTEAPCFQLGIVPLDVPMANIMPSPNYTGTIQKETGSNARGGSGTCIKATPSLTYDSLMYSFLVPVTGSQNTTLSFWHKITSGFNGSVKLTIYDVDDSTKLINQANVTLTDNSQYNQYTSSSFQATATGLCRAVIEIFNGSSSGSVYIDDIAIS